MSEIKYPYYASPERKRNIVDGYQKIKTGIDANEVKRILGEPDEELDLYDPRNIKVGRKVGFTYWYLIQRVKDSGSQIEKDEKLVRVSFNLDGKVTHVDRW
jgi:hypothetical protein